MKYITIKKDNKIICEQTELADHFFRRFMGLMYRGGMDENHGLILIPCNEIHTFGMRFDIDAVTMSDDNIILAIDRCVKPHKICKKVDGGKKVLELCAGIADKKGLQIGDELTFDDKK